MKRNLPPSDESWESDAVWQLLDQVPSVSVGSRFTDDTVRAARLLGKPQPWWRSLLSPAPLAGLASATATLAVIAMIFSGPSDISGRQAAVLDSPQAAAIEDIAETETLIAAADQLDDFSDTELVSLIGF